MKELEMYSISGYGSMIADPVRMDAYICALRRVVKPDSAIMDIGTGTGIFALLACQLGARKVYAIEIGDAIEVAREIAVSSGYADRIEFIQNRSTQVTLRERVDVIMSDLRGVLPFFQHHIPAIADARKRFLVPGGTLIPQRDTLWVTAVEAPDLCSRHVAPWENAGHGLKMEAARRIVTNTWWKDRVRPEQFLAAPKCWATLDYMEIESPDIEGEVILTVARAGISHGFIIWFDAALAEGVQFSNAPGEVELIYGNAFFPWSQPVPLAVGDIVTVSLEARLVGEDYIWNWITHVSDGDRGEIKGHFKQSTFFGAPLSLMRLRKRADSYVPALNEDGQIDRLILEMMNDRVPLGNIAHRTLAQFPSRFSTWWDALTRVADLSGKYT